MLNLDYIDVRSSSRMFDDALIELFGQPPRLPDSPLDPVYADIAASLQQAIEELLLDKVEHLHRETDLDTLCMAGGVALNCVANGRIRHEGPFRDVFVPPAPNDAGGAIGAAMLANLAVGNRQSWGPDASSVPRAAVRRRRDRAVTRFVGLKHRASP